MIWHACDSSSQSFSDPTATIGSAVEVDKIFADKIICSVFNNYYGHDTYTGSLVLQNKVFIKNIVVYNYPNTSQLISGQTISGMGVQIAREIKCIRTKNYTLNNESYEAYDCGVQYTNLIPQIYKTAIKTNKFLK